jgi:hypothetical protein
VPILAPMPILAPAPIPAPLPADGGMFIPNSVVPVCIFMPMACGVDVVIPIP